jgi:hypothetical protein
MKALYAELLHVAEIPVSEDAAIAECYVHGLLSDHREFGEWFSCSKEEAIAAIDKTLTKLRNGEPLDQETLEKTEHWRRKVAAMRGTLAATTARIAATRRKLEIAKPLWGLPPGEVSVKEIARRSGLSVRTLYDNLGPRSWMQEQENEE